MKSLQNNTLRNRWPMGASTTKNVYLCPKIIKGMKISWSKRAGESLNITVILGSNPFAEPIEPLLLHKRRTYRSIVLTRHNKIIYYLNKNTIRIAAIWDTRREPKKQVEELT